MPTVHEIAYSLFGAYRLALADPSGLSYFDRSAAAAWRSFVAAAVVLPSYILLVLLRQGDGETSLPLLMLVETLSYVVGWAAYALVLDELSRLLGCEARYPVFLSAYNWSSILQMLVYVPAVSLAESGLLPQGVGEVLAFAVTVAVLGYQWFVTQVALEVPALTATGLVMLDLLMSVFISGAAESML